MNKWLRKLVLVFLVCLLSFQIILAAEAEKSVSLYDLTWTAAEPGMTLRRVDAATDIYGNHYGIGLTGTTSNVDNHGDYVLNGEYEVFSGTVIRNAGTNPQADLKDPYRTDICVYVYGDGSLLYQSKSVNLEGNEIQEFAVDVTGVDTLRIAVNGKKYISLCNAVLSDHEETEDTESESPLWSAMEQEYNDEVYTSMQRWRDGDTEYYEDKISLLFASGSEFILYNDRVYYMRSDENVPVAPLYSVNLDGSDEKLIDEYCYSQAKFVVAEGKLYYVRYGDSIKPATLVCYDIEQETSDIIIEGIPLCDGNGYLFVRNQSGVFRIVREYPYALRLIATNSMPAYTSKEIVLSDTLTKTDGSLEYRIYDIETGESRQVQVPDTYTGGIYESAPYAFVGEYLFVYGSDMFSQYQISDGTLIQQIPVDHEGAFNYGSTMYYNKKHAAIFNEDTWHVFSGESNEWFADISVEALTETVYNWVLENCRAMTEWGFSMPESAAEFAIRNQLVAYVSEDAVYIACETDPYTRMDFVRTGNEIQNVWIVKVKKDGETSVVGSEFWQ